MGLSPSYPEVCLGVVTDLITHPWYFPSILPQSLTLLMVFPVISLQINHLHSHLCPGPAFGGISTPNNGLGSFLCNVRLNIEEEGGEKEERSMLQKQPWQMLLDPLLLLHTVILTASHLPQTYTSQVSFSLPHASISPLASPWLGDSVWPGWKRISDKESWERRRGVSCAHKSLCS